MSSGESRYPLSPMQQSMVIASSREPASGIYVQQLMCSLREEVDTGCLREAWDLMTERHAILRSTVELEPEGLVQTVHEDATIAWDERDWSSLSPAAYDRELKAFLAADRARGFNFIEGPPHRVAVIRRAQALYQYVWTHHHALIDLHAQLLLLRELFACYDARRRHETHVPPAPAQPFADHVRWLQQHDWRPAETYWRNCLHGFLEPVHLPIEANRRQETDAENAHSRRLLSLPAELTRELESLAERNGITLNTLVQAAWAILLARYSGRHDVVFGATRGCRRSTVAGADAIVGPLLNTVPVRVKVSPEAILVPWLQELRAQWVALRDYENTSGVQVHEWSEVPRGVALFESVVVFERSSLNSALQALGSDWKHRTVETFRRSDTPLTLFGHARPTLELGIAFDQRRFDPENIGRLLGHARTLLEGFVRAPHSRLADLPLLTSVERRQIHEVWNATTREYPREACVHYLFEQQARDMPGQSALIHGGRSLSYGETNARSNQLARHLKGLGVEPDRLVGVFLGRSPEAVIALLAVVKAGGAFLVLDPEAPPQRLRHILSDARVAAVVTNQELAARLNGAVARLICLDSEQGSIASEPQHDLPSSASAANLAYAVYTSGTTGRPKGTLVTHRSLVNFVFATRQRYGITAADRRLQFASLSSDVYVAEVFVQLSSGAAIVLGLQSASTSIADFLRFVDRHGVTVAGMPATYWHEWVASMVDGDPVIPRSLRLVVCGMEQVHASAYETWQRKTGSRLRWVNVYGPSETTVTAATFEAPLGELRRQAVPIGKPIANTRIYLLDPDMNLVPIGVPGEIHIGGDGVARGYLNQPELTAAKFVADPFSADPVARLYRTGDLGEWLPDGNIVFLGRFDDQVKVRGHRVELGEIEEVLRQHPDVRQCAVAQNGAGAEQRLYAYIVLHPARSPDDGNLRRFLAEHLPPHMMPAAVIRIERLPLTPTGKVDRSRLPIPSRDQLLPPETAVAPRNGDELKVAAILEEILGQGPIGVHTDFFSIGGDSLVAIRVASRIQSVFGVQVSVRDVFTHRTVAELSLVVRSLKPRA
jgi:amino acid adenylation domain-containing protein